MGNWHHTDLTLAAGAPETDGNPKGYLFKAQGTLHVFYIGSRASAGHIHELWRNNSGWHWNDLTIASGVQSYAEMLVFDPSVYVFDAQGTQHVVYFGDYHVYELWWDNGGWHNNDLTLAAGVSNVWGDPIGYAFNGQGTQHVIYTASDRHVYELWWDGAWHHNDLCAAAAAPDSSPFSHPATYVFDGQGTQHVVYLGAYPDRHIHELWWDGDWHHNDLTVAAGAPVGSYNGPDPNLMGYVFNAQGTQHLVYRSADNHIYELWWDGDWHHNDLTIAAGAPLIWGDPMGYMFDAQATQHVVFYATDNHIHELLCDKGGWHHNDLTVAAGAPEAFANPIGYVFDAEATQHVFYTGYDYHIHELRWSIDKIHFEETS